MPPHPILLSDHLTRESTVRPNRDFSEKDTHTLRSPAACGFMLALLLACLTGTKAIAEPIIVNKPAMESPETKFDEPELQAKYDEAWKTFAETVEAASAALNKELKARGQAAQEEGNLDLLKFWTEVNEAWEQTGEFEWDADEERRKWDRFAPSGFPHSVTIAARGAVETHRAAIEELQAAYKELERTLVKQGKPESAEEVRQEIAGLLEANDFKNEKGKRRPALARRSRSTVRDQFVGEWVNPAWKYVNIFDAQPGTTDRGKLKRRQADGRITDGGSWLVDSSGQAQIVWQAGGAKGWIEVVKLFPNGLMVGGSRNPKGALSGDGWAAWQKDFDWTGARCQNVEATVEAKAAIDGQWTHPNHDLLWKISDSGEFIEQRKVGGIHSYGTWQWKSDGSYESRLSHGWRIRFWAHDDTLILLPFKPKSNSLAGDGVVCQRIK